MKVFFSNHPDAQSNSWHTITRLAHNIVVDDEVTVNDPNSADLVFLHPTDEAIGESLLANWSVGWRDRNPKPIVALCSSQPGSCITLLAKIREAHPDVDCSILWMPERFFNKAVRQALYDSVAQGRRQDAIAMFRDIPFPAALLGQYLLVRADSSEAQLSRYFDHVGGDRLKDEYAQWSPKVYEYESEDRESLRSALCAAVGTR